MTGRWHLDKKCLKKKTKQVKLESAEYCKARLLTGLLKRAAQPENGNSWSEKGRCCWEQHNNAQGLLYCVTASWYLTDGVGINSSRGLWCGHTSHCVSTRSHLLTKIFRWVFQKQKRKLWTFSQNSNISHIYNTIIRTDIYLWHSTLRLFLCR